MTCVQYQRENQILREKSKEQKINELFFGTKFYCVYQKEMLLWFALFLIFYERQN